MIKVEFFKSVEDLKVIEKGAAVAYYADHTHFRHFSEMLGCFVGKQRSASTLFQSRISASFAL